MVTSGDSNGRAGQYSNWNANIFPSRKNSGPRQTHEAAPGAGWFHPSPGAVEELKQAGLGRVIPPVSGLFNWPWPTPLRV